MFNFNNVFENRAEFKLACRQAGACKEEYAKLISAKNKEDFMQVIYNNYNWINKEIKEFEPKFDDADDFSGGFACVRLNGEWGYINTKGEYLVEPKYDFADDFQEDFARVELNGKYGFINKLGDYLVEPKYDDAWDFREGLARVELNGERGFINTKGEYK